MRFGQLLFILPPLPLFLGIFSEYALPERRGGLSRSRCFVPFPDGATTRMQRIAAACVRTVRTEDAQGRGRCEGVNLRMGRTFLSKFFCSAAELRVRVRTVFAACRPAEGIGPRRVSGGAVASPALPRPACAPSGAGRAVPRGFSAHDRSRAGVRLPVPVAPARRAKTLRRPPADTMSWGVRGLSARTDARRSAGERPRKRRPG